jgi:hypothetical protein
MLTALPTSAKVAVLTTSLQQRLTSAKAAVRMTSSHLPVLWFQPWRP